jgi:hypothetical protein
MNTLAPGATGRRFLGVDVGISGAIAVIDEAGTLIVVYDMPCLAEGAKNRRTINAVLLHSILRDEPPSNTPMSKVASVHAAYPLRFSRHPLGNAPWACHAARTRMQVAAWRLHGGRNMRNGSSAR